MEGLLYFPEAHIYVRGTADAIGDATDCLMLIANTIEFNGTTGINVNNGCSVAITMDWTTFSSRI
jgi:hypothetical protein